MVHVDERASLRRGEGVERVVSERGVEGGGVEVEWVKGVVGAGFECVTGTSEGLVAVFN